MNAVLTFDVSLYSKVRINCCKTENVYIYRWLLQYRLKCMPLNKLRVLER